MSDTLQNQKSLLGKLLATENIRIEHRPVRGPMFDTQSRLLVLPVWEKITGDLYDLMIGHEVGHALYTPSDGWVNRVEELGPNFKQILNIVEDARIEKKMKRKYPGLKQPMVTGYSELVERGFFSVDWKDMNDLDFIDRINLYFKLGVRSMIKFNDTEQQIVDRIESAESFEEVLEIAEQLYEIDTAEQEDSESTSDQVLEGEGADDGEWGDSPDEDESLLESTSDRSGNSAGRGSGNKPQTSDKGDNSEQKREGKEQPSASDSNGAGASESTTNKERKFERTDGAPVTTGALERAMKDHSSVSSSFPTYLKMPVLDLDLYVVSCNVVQQHMTTAFSGYEKQKESAYSKFMNEQRPQISSMVREFEMRKAARQFRRAAVSKTGELDVKKIWKNQLSDDLFLRSTIVPDGKNHGMIMLIDMSSSMSGCIDATIKQTVLLALFCQKIKIPFEVYGFYDTRATELLTQGFSKGDKRVKAGMLTSRAVLRGLPNELRIRGDAPHLKQLLTSSMRSSDFATGVKNLLLLGRSFAWNTRIAPTPTHMHLSGTPLDESIVILKNVADRFNEKYKVDVLNTIILTDGEGGDTLGMCDETGSFAYGYNTYPGAWRIIEDPKSRTFVECKYDKFKSPRDWHTELLVEMYKKSTGSRVIGMYLQYGKDVTLSNAKYYGRASGESDESIAARYAQEYGTSKYFSYTKRGYDVNYLLATSSLGATDVDMDDVLRNSLSKGQALTTSKLLNAFKKMNKTNKQSKVFVTNFIKQIS